LFVTTGAQPADPVINFGYDGLGAQLTAYHR